MLPRKQSTCNGVKTRRAYLFDRTTKWPDYEEELLATLRTHVTPDDSVVIVGGGWGVSAVTAAERGATVTVYEPSNEQVERVKETADLNDVVESVTVQHAKVGETGEVWGKSSASVVSPSDLPECDLLELDCEGAELEILRAITVTPDVIAVECHPSHGVSEDDVRAVMTDLGYEITNRAHESQSDSVVILTGELHSGS
ncbi:FkbM family methyltransferase [Halobacterium hubeiense]|uniref:FkbM family methyltransferase n=1 Tax=Halobacterium hubeiense TaxID=1407499 RepID=UPI00146FD763|nr:FkbM family methyltransferase [Halobacterium hubeiense]